MLQIPLPILVPLCSAFLYALAVMGLKRCTAAGLGPWRVGFVTNWVQGLGLAPLWFLGGQPFAPEHLLHAMICGLAFFLGQVFTFLALSRGDVSVATPVLGTKVLFVALVAVWLGTEPLTASLWMAAILTALATALMGYAGRHRRHPLGVSLGLGLGAAASFALTDVLGQKWAPAWGFGHFAPAMFATVAVLSLGLLPLCRGSFRHLPWRWVGMGSALLTLQCGGVAYSIMNFGSATTTNVVYNSRGIWSVLIVWGIGHWFGNDERSQGHRVMLGRLAGATLLMVAIVLVAR